jgi:hypothetical protein
MATPKVTLNALTVCRLTAGLRAGFGSGLGAGVCFVDSMFYVHNITLKTNKQGENHPNSRPLKHRPEGSSKNMIGPLKPSGHSSLF